MHVLMHFVKIQLFGHVGNKLVIHFGLFPWKPINQKLTCLKAFFAWCLAHLREFLKLLFKAQEAVYRCICFIVVK